MTGIGGDCFALIAKPGRRKLIALNGSGRAPAAATPAFFAGKGVKRFETTSVHSVTVPGAVDAWCRLLEDYGSMPLETLLAPAIAQADKGFVVASRVAADWAIGKRKLTGAGAKLNLLKDGRAPKAGEIMRFPALAKTLKKIAKEGRAGFYEGDVARDMVKELNALGGCHTLQDFSAQRSTYVEPIAVDYRGVDLCELPPSNHGIVALIMLRMLARLGKPPSNPFSAERFLRRRPRHGRCAGGPHVERRGHRHACQAHRPPQIPPGPRADPAPGRIGHGVLLHRRREGHGSLVHQLALRRLRHRHRHGQDGRCHAQPRRGLRA
jgi:gamma-glutamyltranspeptidase/glutathione hydrolase